MSKLIMIIDDVQEILDLYQIILNEEGYQLSLHKNKPDDIDQVKDLKPDLIICDLVLSGRNSGWGFIQELKTEPSLANIPTILCTANSSLLGDFECRLKDNNVQVLQKPFDIDFLLESVRDSLATSH